jgi:putative ATP-binding cassette transporter
MSADSDAAASSPAFAVDHKVAKAFARFASGYWSGPTAFWAWALTFGLAAFLIGSTLATVALNRWNRWFFDALEKRDVAEVWNTVLIFPVIVIVMAGIGVGIVVTRETLQVHWRQWLINALVARWLGERRFYDLNATRTEPANPEYRISDDTRWATEPLTDLVIGLVIAVLNAGAFISILWSVGGSYTLVLGATSITIPAYMVVVALIYGIVMSSLMVWMGARLPGYVYAKNEREGDFRFALMRLRDNAESVALMQGHVRERTILARLFDNAVVEWIRIVRKHGHLTWITNSSGPMLPIVPLLFAAPKFLAGELTLGQVTQLAGAFVAVQAAISWIPDNFNRLSEWYASAQRVMDIITACDASDARRTGGPDRIRFEDTREPGLMLDEVAVRDPFGTTLVSRVDLDAPAGSATLVVGDTSIGKSTLVRAISGLWTRGSGSIAAPAGAKIMIVPQKAYLPLGTLAETLTYPDDTEGAPTRDLESVLTLVGLGHLVGRLDESARWDQRLSNGERQRLALARLLAHRPDIVVLDDALSALDEASQSGLLRLLRAQLPDAAIVSLGQNSASPGIFDRIVRLQRDGEGARLDKAVVPAQ